MKNCTKKAVILNDVTSPYIYQAIVILNEKGIRNENKALEDAEKIVSEYMAKVKKDASEDILLYSRPVRKPIKKKSYNLFFLSLGLIALFLGFFIFIK